MVLNGKSVGKVKIQIGLQHKEDESLKPLKDRMLPLTVDSDVNATALPNQAVTKYSNILKHLMWIIICCTQTIPLSNISGLQDTSGYFYIREVQ